MSNKIAEIASWFGSVAEGGNAPDPSQWEFQPRKVGWEELKIAHKLRWGVEEARRWQGSESPSELVTQSARSQEQVFRLLARHIADGMKNGRLSKSELKGIWLALIASESRFYTLISLWQPSVGPGHTFRQSWEEQARRARIVLRDPVSGAEISPLQLHSEFSKLKVEYDRKGATGSITKAERFLAKKYGVAKNTIHNRLDEVTGKKSGNTPK